MLPGGHWVVFFGFWRYDRVSVGRITFAIGKESHRSCCVSDGLLSKQ